MGKATEDSLRPVEPMEEAKGGLVGLRRVDLLAEHCSPRLQKRWAVFLLQQEEPHRLGVNQGQPLRVQDLGGEVLPRARFPVEGKMR